MVHGSNEMALNKLCINQDWSYQYSDDHHVYSKGKAGIALIHRLRRDLGAKGDEIYNRWAPISYRVHRYPGL